MIPLPAMSVPFQRVAMDIVGPLPRSRSGNRVGLPEEILTDQGSNFCSQLLGEVYRLLHIHGLRTSPYHPQSDGLVERFNQTLKEMLRKTASEEGKDWDKLIPYVLFAYREVPQESTGFSPFELLYGREVRGPLDVLKEKNARLTRWSFSLQPYQFTVEYRPGKGIGNANALSRVNWDAPPTKRPTSWTPEERGGV